MAYLRPIINITFTSKTSGKKILFDFATDVETVEDVENFTQTATIVFPRKIVFKGQNLFTGTNAIFRRGDKVKVEIGYFKEKNTPLEGLKELYNGYISYVNGSLPVTIECEDEMFVLKNTKCTYPKKVGLITVGKHGKKLKKPKVISAAISLNDLLGNILPDDIVYKCLDVNLGSFRCSNASVSQILEKLKSEYGLYSRFVGGVLMVGFASDSSDTKTQEFIFERTIIDETQLQYQLKEDLSVKVVAISMQPNNTKKEITVGDTDGAQRTYYTYNATDEGLKKFANLKLDRVRYSGYVGSFTTFGEPMVRAGDIAQLTSRKLPERNGFYDIISVRRKFSVKDGYKQTIEIGQYFGASQTEALANIPK